MRQRPSVVLVTGLGKIGFELSKRLLMRGCDLVVCYRHSENRALELMSIASGLGRRVIPLKVDLTHESSPREIRGCLVESFGYLNSYVHTASVFKKSYLQDLDLNTVMENLMVDCLSFMMVLKSCLNLFEEGRVLVFGDKNPSSYKDRLTYTLSKSALIGVIEALSQQVKPHVLLNMISPSKVDEPSRLEDLLNLSEYLTLDVKGISGEIFTV